MLKCYAIALLWPLTFCFKVFYAHIVHENFCFMSTEIMLSTFQTTNNIQFFFVTWPPQLGS
jgi:hypothetical protein